MKHVLFLCSGNYYRSRFAEHVFNWLALRHNLSWRARSRGLTVGLWGNIGPISSHTLKALRQREIPLEDPPRHPRPLAAADLAGAELVVAVKEAEHRAMMAVQFPRWVDRVEYWHVDDLDCADSAEALPMLESNLRALVARLLAAEAAAA